MEVPGRATVRVDEGAAAPAIEERNPGTAAALRPFGAIGNALFVPAHGLRIAVSTRLRFTRGYSPPPLRGESGGSKELHLAESISEVDPCSSIAGKTQVCEYAGLWHRHGTQREILAVTKH